MKSALPLALLLGALLALPATPLAHADDDRGTIMDLSFEDAPIGKVIQAIARFSGRNVVVAPDVKGNVTVKLVKVDWRKAFELIAKTHNLDVQHQPGNITIVRKRAGEPRSVKIRTAKLRAAETEAAEASRRQTDLVNEIAASKARIAALEREIARAEANRLRAAKSVAKARASEELVEEVEIIKEDPVAWGNKAVQTIQIHDVKDLVQKRKKHIEKLMAKVKASGGHAQWHGTNLVVRGTPKTQGFMRQGLEDLRAKAAKDAFVVVGKDGEKRKVRLVEGAVVDTKGRFVEWTKVQQGGAGGKAGAVKHAEDMKKLQDRIAVAETQMVETQRRIENLSRALDHLKKANARHEAERVAKQLAAAKDQYAQARAQMQRVSQALAESRKRRTEAEAARRGATRIRFSEAASTRHGGGIEAVRAEVRALRGEVRELTGLVRKLLEMQEQRGPRRRGAR